MFKRIILAITLIASLSVFNGCGDDEGSATSYSYNGAGSYWSVTLEGDGTFTITLAATYGGATTMTVNGTYVRYSSGFMKLTVTSASGTGAPTAGDAAYAVEIPGTVFLLKPIGGDSEIIPMIASGTCPTSDFSANWLIASCSSGGGDCDASSTSQDYYGQFDWANATSTGSLPSKYDLQSGSNLGSGTVGSATCSNGVIDINNGETYIYITEAKNAIVHPNADDENNDQVIFAVNQTAISSLASKTYAIVGFSQASSDTFAANIVFNSAGTSATAYEVDETNISTGTNGTQVATIGSITLNSPLSGFLTAQLDDGTNPATPFVCAINGEVIACIGQDPTDTTKQFSLMGAEL